MKKASFRYRGYRFPAEIISYAVWLYHRFCMSLRDMEDLLAERGVLVSYETIRAWCRKFGPGYVRNLRRRQGRSNDEFLEFFMGTRSAWTTLVMAVVFLCNQLSVPGQ